MPRLKLEDVCKAVKKNGHIKTDAEIAEERKAQIAEKIKAADKKKAAEKITTTLVPTRDYVDVFADTHDLTKKFFSDIEYKRDYERLAFEISRWKEELNETIDAINKGDAEGVVDGAIDLVTFILGTLENFGVDGAKAWKVVHDANMSKKRGTKSTRSNSGGVDLVKPKGWKAPDHSDNVGMIAEALKLD